MIDPYYQSYHKDAMDMRAKWHDARDLPDHPDAVHISNQFEHLVAQAKTGSQARGLYDTAKGIQRRVWQAQNQGKGIISDDHSNYFRQRLETFSNNVRNHPHFN